MNKQGPLYCKWADAGLALHNRGGALLCCQSRTYLKDRNDNLIYWHTHRLEDAWNSPTRHEIQQALDNGHQHPNCNACWDEENVGGMSRRMHTLREDSISVPEIFDSPALMDLKLGNICNLACRTCNPDVSSKWYSDWWTTIDQHTGQFHNYRQYLDARYLTGKLSYSRDNEQLWSTLSEWFPHVRYVDIYGAEPMMIDRLFDVLQTSIDRGHAQHQVLHFNTNGTIWNQNHIDILTQFEKVYFDLSIDGLGTKFDYIRHGETWQTISDNVNRYDQLRKTFPQHYVSICVTVSILNILYVDEIWHYFNSRGWNVHFNLAHMPSHINFKALPDAVKIAVTEKLTKLPDPAFQQHAQALISYMNEPRINASDWDEFVRITRELDQRRGQNFATTFPELYQLIKDDWERV